MDPFLSVRHSHRPGWLIVTVLLAFAAVFGVVGAAAAQAPNTLTNTGSLAAARYEHTATLLQNGKVLVAGGLGYGGYLASAELYDPVTGTWMATGSLAAARTDHTATLLPNG